MAMLRRPFNFQLLLMLLVSDRARWTQVHTAALVALVGINDDVLATDAEIVGVLSTAVQTSRGIGSGITHVDSTVGLHRLAVRLRRPAVDLLLQKRVVAQSAPLLLH